MIARLPNGSVIFVHIPRTSGTSIEASFPPVQESAKHLRASQLERLAGPEWTSAYKFSIVRNPFDRVISLFHSPYYKNINRHSGKSLEYFLENYYLPPWEQGTTLCDYLDRDIDDIFFFENRGREMTLLNKKLSGFGWQVNTELKLRKLPRPIDYRQFYTATTKQLVEHIYKEDLDRFNYSF